MIRSPRLSRLSFVVLVLLLLADPLGAEELSDCFQGWKKKHSKYEAKVSGSADLVPGARPLELESVNLAEEQKRTFRFTVRAPGLLKLRNVGSDPFDAYLYLRSSPERTNERSVGFGTLEKGKTVSVLVVPGQYHIRLEESGEYEEPMCPPLSYRAAVTVTPPDSKLAPLLMSPWADETTILPTPKPVRYQATLAALNAEPTFVTTLEKPSFVEVILADGEASRTRLLLNGKPQGSRLRALALWSFSFSLERAEGGCLESAEAVNFTIKVVPFQGERIFESIPEKATVELLNRVAAKLVLKNLAPLDFRKVTLLFEPTFTGAATPPGMTPIVIRGRQAWTKTFDVWKATEEKFVDFGVLFPRVERVQSYFLSMSVTTLELEDGPIQVTSEHLLTGEISLAKTATTSSPQQGLAVEQANAVEHPDYEEQLKIPVMTNCARKYHPKYGEPFEKCQGLVFEWRNRCSATHRVTTPAFVECVRKGLESIAPELLKRP